MTSIKPKKKPCKNCGNPDYLRHGKCTICYKDWLLNTPEGQAKLNKCTLIIRKDTEKRQKAELKERKQKLMSVDEYRSKIVQPIINEIARLIDYGQPCIATGNYGKLAAGHFIAVGSNRTLALHLDNLHVQCFHSNCMKGGDNLKYREGLKRVYGQSYLDHVESLKQIPAIHLSKNDLEIIANKARKIRKELKNDISIHSPEERIKMRDMVNKKLGIMKPEKEPHWVVCINNHPFDKNENPVCPLCGTVGFECKKKK